MTTHTYETHLVWDGRTADGYRAYSREHRATTAHGPEVTLSADPAFRGDASRLNPEQLVVMAASSCQLLSFLGAAARAEISVTGYVDQARGTMPDDDPPTRITLIELAPTIQVAAGTDLPWVHQLVRDAHEQCYVAQSLRATVRVRPTVVVG